MKKILLLLCLMYASYANAQSGAVTADGTAISISKTIQTDTLLNKNTLYVLGLQWFVIAARDQKVAIQMKDMNAGIIIASGTFTYADTIKASATSPATYPVKEINYTIQLSFEDQKVKYDIYNFISKDGAVIKTGNLTVDTAQNNVTINQENFYKRSYANAQISCNHECLSVGRSITAYFLRQHNESAWQ